MELNAEAREKGYFRLTPDKGTVAPGAAAVEISCAFEPPPAPPKIAGPAGSKEFAAEVRKNMPQRNCWGGRGG